MRETRADTAQAMFFALALHAALFALVLFGMWWTRVHPPVSAAGSPVEADVVAANTLSKPLQRALRERPPAPVEAMPPPQPIPEPRPEDAPVPQQPKAQERVPEPDTVDQERVDRDALSALTRAREQEEKRRQEQIDLTEQQHQEEAEQARRLAQLQQQRIQQLADIRKQRAQAAKEADLAEQKLKQIADAQARNAAQAVQADATASQAPGNNGVDTDLLARYQAALQDAILRNWVRPDSVPLGQRCKLVIRQLPGGEVMDVQVSASCPYDELGRRSVEAAVLKAQPLPYAGFESVFSRNLTLNFEAQDR